MNTLENKQISAYDRMREKLNANTSDYRQEAEETSKNYYLPAEEELAKQKQSLDIQNNIYELKKALYNEKLSNIANARNPYLGKTLNKTFTVKNAESMIDNPEYLDSQLAKRINDFNKIGDFENERKSKLISTEIASLTNLLQQDKLNSKYDKLKDLNNKLAQEKESLANTIEYNAKVSEIQGNNDEISQRYFPNLGDNPVHYGIGSALQSGAYRLGEGIAGGIASISPLGGKWTQGLANYLDKQNQELNYQNPVSSVKDLTREYSEADSTLGGIYNFLRGGGRFAANTLAESAPELAAGAAVSYLTGGAGTGLAGSLGAKGLQSALTSTTGKIATTVAGSGIAGMGYKPYELAKERSQRLDPNYKEGDKVNPTFEDYIRSFGYGTLNAVELGNLKYMLGLSKLNQTAKKAFMESPLGTSFSALGKKIDSIDNPLLKNKLTKGLFIANKYLTPQVAKVYLSGKAEGYIEGLQEHLEKLSTHPDLSQGERDQYAQEAKELGELAGWFLAGSGTAVRVPVEGYQNYRSNVDNKTKETIIKNNFNEDGSVNLSNDFSSFINSINTLDLNKAEFTEEEQKTINNIKEAYSTIQEHMNTLNNLSKKGVDSYIEQFKTMTSLDLKDNDIKTIKDNIINDYLISRNALNNIDKAQELGASNSYITRLNNYKAVAERIKQYSTLDNESKKVLKPLFKKYRVAPNKLDNLYNLQSNELVELYNGINSVINPNQEQNTATKTTQETPQEQVKRETPESFDKTTIDTSNQAKSISTFKELLSKGAYIGKEKLKAKAYLKVIGSVRDLIDELTKQQPNTDFSKQLSPVINNLRELVKSSGNFIEFIDYIKKHNPKEVFNAGKVDKQSITIPQMRNLAKNLFGVEGKEYYDLVEAIDIYEKATNLGNHFWKGGETTRRIDGKIVAVDSNWDNFINILNGNISKQKLANLNQQFQDKIDKLSGKKLYNSKGESVVEGSKAYQELKAERDFLQALINLAHKKLNEKENTTKSTETNENTKEETKQTNNITKEDSEKEQLRKENEELRKRIEELEKLNKEPKEAKKQEETTKEYKDTTKEIKEEIKPKEEAIDDEIEIAFKSPKDADENVKKEYESLQKDNEDNKSNVVNEEPTQPKYSPNIFAGIEPIINKDNNSELYEAITKNKETMEQYTKDIGNLVLASREGKELMKSLGLDVKPSINKQLSKEVKVGKDKSKQYTTGFELSISDTLNNSDDFNERANTYLSVLGKTLQQDNIKKSLRLKTNNKTIRNTIRLEFNRDIDYKDLEYINEVLEKKRYNFYLNNVGRRLDIVFTDKNKNYTDLKQEIITLLNEAGYNDTDISTNSSGFYTRNDILNNSDYGKNINKRIKDERRGIQLDNRGELRERGDSRGVRGDETSESNISFEQSSKELKNRTNELNEQYIKQRDNRNTTKQSNNQEETNSKREETTEQLDNNEDVKADLENKFYLTKIFNRFNNLAKEKQLLIKSLILSTRNNLLKYVDIVKDKVSSKLISTPLANKVADSLLKITPQSILDAIPNDKMFSTIYKSDKNGITIKDDTNKRTYNFNTHYDLYQLYIYQDEKGNLQVANEFINAIQKAVLLAVSTTSALRNRKAIEKNLRTLLGLGENEDVPTSDYNALKDVVFIDNLIDILGRNIAKDLGFKKKKFLGKEDIQEYRKYETALGLFAFKLMTNETNNKTPIFNVLSTERIKENGKDKIFTKEVFRNNKWEKEEYNKYADDTYARAKKALSNNSNFSGVSEFRLTVLNPKVLEQFKSNKPNVSLKETEKQVNNVKNLYDWMKLYNNQEDQIADLSLQPIKKHRKQDKNTIYNIPKKLEDTINKLSSTPFRFNTKIVDRLIKISKENIPIYNRIKQALGYIDPNSIEYKKLSFKDKESQNSINEGIERSLDFLLNREDYDNIKDKDIFFDYRMWKNGRFGINSNTINPQSDKLHRFSVVLKDQLNQEIDLSDVNTNINTIKAIGMALGITFDKTSTKTYLDTFNNELKARFNKEIPLVKDRRLNIDYLISDEFSKDINEFKKFIMNKDNIEEFGLSFNNIINLEDLANKLKQNPTETKFKDTLFLFEIDGVTNGVIYKNALMPLHNLTNEKDKEAYISIMNKGGIDFTGKHKEIGEYFEEGNQDLYKTFASHFLENLKNNEIGKIILNIFDSFGMALEKNNEITKIGRNLFKPLVMVFSYGAGIKNITKTFMNEIDSFFTKKMAELSYEYKYNPNSNKQEIINTARETVKNYLMLLDPNNKDFTKINEVTDIVLDKILNEDIMKELKTESKYASVFNTSIDFFENALTKVFNKLFPNAIELNNSLNSMARDLYDLYTSQIRNLNEYVKNPKYFKDGKFTGDVDLNIEGLNYDEAVSLLQQTLLPTLDRTYMEENFSIPIMTNTIDTMKNPQGEIVDVTINGVGDRNSNMILPYKANVKENTIGLPGAALPVANIHSIDGMNMINIASKFPLLQIFDAIVTDPKMAYEYGKAYNNNFFNQIKNINPIDILLNRIDKIPNIFNKAESLHEIFDKKQLKNIENLRKYDNIVKSNKEILLKNENITIDQLAGVKNVIDENVSDKYNAGKQENTTTNEETELSIEELANDNALSKEIYDRVAKIDARNGKTISDKHSNALRSLLDTFVDASKKFLPNIKVILSEVKEGNNYANFDINKKVLNLAMSKNILPEGTLSNQELYLHELIHAVTVFALTSARHKLGREISILKRMYKEFMQDLKVEDLIDPNNLNTQQAYEVAKDIYDSLRSKNGLEEFIAYGMTNERMRERLESMKLSPLVEKHSGGKGIINFIQNVLGKILNILSDRDIKKQNNDVNMLASLEYVTYEIARVNNNMNAKDSKTKLAMQSFMDNVLKPINDKWYDKVGKLFADYKISKGKTFQEIDPKKVGHITSLKNIFKNLFLIYNDKDALNIWRDLMAEIYPNIWGYGGSIQSLIDDFTKPDEFQRKAQELQAKSSRIDAYRNTLKYQHSQALKEIMSKEYSKEEAQSFGRSILDTDLSVLSMEELKEALQNPKAMREALFDKVVKEAKETYKTIPEMTKHIDKYLSIKAMELAEFMLTGKSLGNGIALNAYSILNFDGLDKDKVITIIFNIPQSLIENYDKYITLLALENINKGDFNFLKDTFDNKNDDVKYLLNTLKKYKEQSRETIFKYNPRNELKGYSAENYESQVDLKIDYIKNADKLASEGYLLVNEKLDDGRGIFLNTWSPEVSYNRTATRLINSNSRGTTFKEILEIDIDNFGVDEASQRFNEKTNKFKNKVFKQNYDLLFKGIDYRNRNTLELNNNNESIVPIYADYGYIDDFRYVMSKKSKEKYLGLDRDIFDTVGSMYGIMADKVYSQAHNKQIADLIIEEYDKSFDRTKPQRPIVRLSPNSKDPKIRTLYRMIPYEMREELKAYFKENDPLNDDEKIEIPIREDMLVRLFGFKSLSITNSELYKSSKNRAMKFTSQIAEEILKLVAMKDKAKIVIKTPAVFMGNIISNVMQCVVLGVNPIDSVKMQLQGVRFLKNYRNERGKLIKLQIKKEAGYNVQENIDVIKENLKKNPVTPLIDAGFFTNIVEDLETNEDSKLEKFILNNTYDRMPSILQDVIDITNISKGTKAFKVLHDVTQYSDFVARWCVYQNMLNQGMKSEDIIPVLRDNFIDYDLPTSKWMKFLQDIGIFYFIKFPTRMQRVLKENLEKHPLNVLLMLGSTELADQAFNLDIDNSYEAFLPRKAARGVLGAYVNNPIELLENMMNLAFMPDGLEILGGKEIKL